MINLCRFRTWPQLLTFHVFIFMRPTIGLAANDGLFRNRIYLV